jgi:acyl-CoA reductase-like NAD-dependent aldehyde dehydrogenase
MLSAAEGVHRLSHWVNGEAIPSDPVSEIYSPSDTDDLVSRSPSDDGGVVDLAVASARAAQPSWSHASTEARADVLDRAGDLLLANRETIGRLLSREQGKILPEGIGEATRAGRIFKYFAGESLRSHGRTLASTRPGVQAQTIRGPVGVVAQVTPWNFPLAIPAWKIAPALAFGNSVVLKPSEYTPAIATLLAALLDEAGLPNGVLNLVLAGADGARALTAHPDIDAISFTGSQATGAAIAAVAAAGQKRVQLEMGGKNPLVVLDDADLDLAVECALDGGFYSSGQRCTASSKILATPAIYDSFVDRLSARVSGLRVGHALRSDSDIGPVANERQFEKVLDYIEGARRAGGRITAGGHALRLATPGHYIAPTLVVDTDADMRINREEVFGPVASIIPVESFDEALELANRGDFGLSAGIVTKSLSSASRFQREVRAGLVMVNLPTAGVDYHMPFGGVRRSSHGPREQGFAAGEFYTELRTLYTRA